MSSRDKWIIFSALLVGALLRCFCILEVSHNPDFRTLLLDESYHDYWARQIAFGKAAIPEGLADPRIADTPYFRPPGYAFFLSTIYGVSTNPFAVRGVQAILGLFSCFGAYWIARRWFGSVVAAILLCLMAVSWQFIYYETKLLDAALLVPLIIGIVACACLLVDRIRILPAIMAGILAGATALVRPNILAFVVVLVPWILWVGARQNRLKLAAWACIFLAVGTAAVIAPVTIRNYLVGREFVLVSCNGGINLFFGNNETSNGVDASHPELSPWSCFDYPAIVRNMELRENRPIKFGESSALFAGRAMKFIKENPGKALALTLRKTALFWGPAEIDSENDIGTERRNSSVLRYLPVQFPLVLALALTGCVIFCLEYLRKRRAADPLTTADGKAGQVEVVALLALLVVAYSTSIVFFIVSGRYRVPLIPFLMLGAAYALEKVYGFVRDGNWRDVRGLAIVFAVFYLPANFHVGGFGEKPSAFHLHRGIAYEREGNINAAIAEYEAVLRLNKNDPMAHCRLGEVFRQRGDFQQASAQFAEAVRLDPTLADAHVGLGKLYGRAGRFNDAMAEFNTAIGISPVNWEAHAGLGTTFIMLGDKTGAEKEFLDALAQNPKATEVMLCLAQLSLDAGRKADAMRYVERALAVDRKSKAALLFKRRLEEGE